MNIKLNHKTIKEMCGTVSFKRGDSFYRAKKVTIHEYREDFCEATVNGTDPFHVKIYRDSVGNIKTTCSCPTLANFQKDCQHIAAVLLAIYDRQRLGRLPVDVENLHASYGELTEGFIKLFNEQPARVSGHQSHFEKREILDVRFTCKPVLLGNQYLFGIEISIDYSFISNIREFLLDVKQGRASLISSTEQYDPNLHCFINEVDNVIHQLIKVVHDERTFLDTLPKDTHFKTSDQTLLIPPSSWKGIASLLIQVPDVVLEYNGHYFNRFELIDGPPPLQFRFEEGIGDGYKLIIHGFDRMIVMNTYHSILCDGKIFQLERQDGERLTELKDMLAIAPGKEVIPIPKEQMNIFLEKIVPGLKRLGEVQLSRSLSQEFLKTPLVARLYLDRLKGRLLVGLEFQYENMIIQPLENRDIPTGPMIIRDLVKEEEILQIMDNSGFSKTDGGYFLQNEELEYEFLYHILPTLQKLVQVYATTAVRTRIVRKSEHLKIRVKVKKERTNWLEYKFEMDGIADQEIRHILTALEEKRKYYRLQNGSLLSLETKEMEEIRRFLHAVPVQDDQYEASLDMPVIESLKFLDSFEDGNVFAVEESFREFLQSIKHPEKIDFEVPESLISILRDYQIHGYKWMKTLARNGFGGVLADDMGLGKTLQSISFIVSELSSIRDKKRPVLIVCPSSLTYNWLNEIMKFAPELQAVVIDGKNTERQELQRDIEGIDIIITSYPLLRRDINWYEKQAFHTIFFDEAQAFKNPMTQTARAVKKLKSDYRFGLTGTPMENSIEELWSIFYVIFPQLFQGLQEYSHLSRKAIARRVRPFLLRRLKEDVLSELPEKMETLESAELLPEQKKLYAAYLAKLRHDTLKHLDKDTIRKNRIRILAGITRLRQICCHPALFAEGYKGSSAKFEQLLQIIEEARQSGRRVLIFSQFTKMLALIGSELTMRGETYFYLDGQTPSEDRVEICNRFNEGERNFFLISLKAGGTGLNLTGADTVIHYDLWWNPAVEEQATDRAYRMGQKNAVQVIKLIARGTIEEKMNELQERKRHLIADIIDTDELASSSLTEEDIREILTI